MKICQSNAIPLNIKTLFTCFSTIFHKTLLELKSKNSYSSITPTYYAYEGSQLTEEWLWDLWKDALKLK